MSRIGRRLRARPEYVVAALLLVLLVATSAGYGWHRDELYFVVAGQHPDWGYPDQPLFTPFVVAGLNALGGGSLVIVRLAAALAGAGTVLVVGGLVGELGGGARARLLGSVSWAVGGVSLVTGHFVDTTTFDVLATAGVCLCLLRAIRLESGRWMVLAGAVLGLGLLNKLIVGALIGVVVIAFLAIGPRRMFLTRHAILGLGLAILGAAPYLVWQAFHGFPQLSLVSGISQQGSEGGRVGVLPFQLILVSVFLCAFWIAGLVRILRARHLRAFGVAYLAMLILLIASSGKAYYAAGLLPLLVASGGVATDLWIARGRRGVKVALTSIAIVLAFALNAVLGLPVTPVQKLQASGVDGINPDAGEQVGWVTLTKAVAKGYTSLPRSERATATIFTVNYSTAGAVDKFGPALGLPSAFSGQNAFALWGPPKSSGAVVLVGFDRSDPDLKNFEGCHIVTRVDNGYQLHNQEQGDLIEDCTGTRGSWAKIWPSLVFYG